ncbi:HDIG domain-containing metalloprotein [Clostridium magnum]|uniref:HDIG domain-containing metalloprotein n=1 Tax=Clostridium magnum TaxID=33954 RepID=UPI00082D26C3|nr:HDIG domain-containing metalloprotein [Clostridium magnum]
MDFYRVKQFYWAINPKITNEDLDFLHSNLSKNELKLFYKLPAYDQKHSIKVAYDVTYVCKENNIESKLLVKAALLHDIGKVHKKLNIIDKSIMVLVDNITKGGIKKLSNIEKVNVYYNHGTIGKDILKNYNYDPKLLYLIENHHNYNVIGNFELDILRMCDDRN